MVTWREKSLLYANPLLQMPLWTQQCPLETLSLERKSPGEDAQAYCVAESIATWPPFSTKYGRVNVFVRTPCTGADRHIWGKETQVITPWKEKLKEKESRNNKADVFCYTTSPNCWHCMFALVGTEYIFFLLIVLLINEFELSETSIHETIHWDILMHWFELQL